jgi:glycosyltransferase involved in cell wall biosynthesis
MTAGIRNQGREHQSLAVLILTRDEESNIEKCLRSVLPLTNRIFIVDSGSTDRTVEIAEKMGARVIFHPWTSHAEQFNWGLDNASLDSDWVMRLDADEEVTPGLVAALRETLPTLAPDVTGIIVRRQVHFMGRWIRHGGYYPTWLLRVFRRDAGRCEALWMDEHISLSHGRAVRLDQDIIDRNNKDLTFWTAKHNSYATREVLDVIAREGAAGVPGRDVALPDVQTRSRRWIKNRVYGRLPLFVRPLLYFLYRYVLRLGFLDGREGLIFHVLQGFWYRFLVDAKLYERRKAERAARPEEPKPAGREELRR